MKREEHYCDQCGTQMTEQDCEGDTVCFGIKVLTQKPADAHTTNAAVVVDTTLKHSCGSSSSRHNLHGTEFCSFQCFQESMLALIAKVKTTMDKS
jgi:hypothetical protein